VSVHNDLVRAIDRGHVSCLVLLDLSSAFDTMDHSLLLSLLTHRFAVTDTSLSWFQSYLSNCSQSFLFTNHRTAPYSLDCGVPQGSVLGPLEFICYTADVSSVFDRHKVQFHLFADDKQAYSSGPVSDVTAMRRRLSDCATDVAKWFAPRRLQLNAGKQLNSLGLDF